MMIEQTDADVNTRVSEQHQHTPCMLASRDDRLGILKLLLDAKVSMCVYARVND
jgi:hypothetical protein